MAISEYPYLLRYSFIRNELSQGISPATFRLLATLFNDTCNIGKLLQKANLEDVVNGNVKVYQFRQLKSVPPDCLLSL